MHQSVLEPSCKRHTMMRVSLIIIGSAVFIWILLVYLSFYWPSCTRAVRFYAYTLIAVGILNFTSFWAISLVIGGDAVGNAPENGRYYVSEHGRRTQVSQAVYQYSLFHAHSVWGTHPLALLAGLILMSEDKKRNLKPAATGEASARRRISPRSGL